MRTYQSRENSEKKMSKRALITLLTSCGVVAIALAVTLAIVLTKEPDKVVPEPVPTVKPITFVVPVEGATLGQEFNIDELVYSSTLNQWRTHSGVDFLAEKGTAVNAVADGTVTSVKNTTLEGYVVTITHKDGYISIYKSLGREIPVNEGQEIAAGDKIGVVDTTMITEQAEGAHLHLELKKNGSLVNPLDYVPFQGEK